MHIGWQDCCGVHASARRRSFKIFAKDHATGACILACSQMALELSQKLRWTSSRQKSKGLAFSREATAERPRRTYAKLIAKASATECLG